MGIEIPSPRQPCLFLPNQSQQSSFTSPMTCHLLLWRIPKFRYAESAPCAHQTLTLTLTLFSSGGHLAIITLAVASAPFASRATVVSHDPARVKMTSTAERRWLTENVDVAVDEVISVDVAGVALNHLQVGGTILTVLTRVVQRQLVTNDTHPRRHVLTWTVSQYSTTKRTVQKKKNNVTTNLAEKRT